jgi:hypothetical protein
MVYCLKLMAGATCANAHGFLRAMRFGRFPDKLQTITEIGWRALTVIGKKKLPGHS